MLDRHPGSRIEYVTITAAAEIEVALVIAARRNGAVHNVDSRDGAVRCARITNADVPRRAVRQPADCAHVAAEIHESMRDPLRRANRCGAIRRVFLANTPEIDLHPGLREANRVGVPFDPRPSGQAARCCKRFR